MRVLHIAWPRPASPRACCSRGNFTGAIMKCRLRLLGEASWAGKPFVLEVKSCEALPGANCWLYKRPGGLRVRLIFVFIRVV